jgi:hypothetical protein
MDGGSSAIAFLFTSLGFPFRAPFPLPVDLRTKEWLNTNWFLTKATLRELFIRLLRAYACFV